ncbi:hypothetical protein [Calothrix sp. NIES-3974]|uniref:hypothetical protein n=1 Tax=Calothrix sp. NIES-3974 TaxID=2005462 RepID=UPI000B612FDE|nr:hypothetical protein [Calothrix sp. NIES-3974]BAZ03555.1 hypothetical protein NIES3974_01830 [Calothrix sp. NIES-3974]
MLNTLSKNKVNIRLQELGVLFAINQSRIAIASPTNFMGRSISMQRVILLTSLAKVLGDKLLFSQQSIHHQWLEWGFWRN